ncbi:hypothetical protein BSK49_15900 [Paenibacillus odorifer]|jgi:hypothetical protein|uniref:Uncharacterized protein n=1 Tax=Paenibacillus odorifer TaxID=189426 RepID=A0ABX3GXI9_9BACL|nr:hypothetical protein [Paenibacillus odorifer]OMD39927.1 hypothetical protein BSO21_01720 [Paenibacillus odorifer]OMD88141.1 hypothetical protein BSK49_15900 [Paenibacillus odorifer]
MFYTNDMVFVSCRATKNDKFAIYTFVDLASWERYQFLGNQNLTKDIPDRSKVVASFTLSKKDTGFSVFVHAITEVSE